MPYITVSNSKKVLRTLEGEKLDGIDEKLYKWDIYFFSKWESGRLKGIRELFRDPDNFLAQYYEPIVVVDSYRYIFPESHPAYHKNNECERLKSNFKNHLVPGPIRDKGAEEVQRFRKLYHEHEAGKKEAKQYIEWIQVYFPYVGEMNPKTVEYDNSGAEEKKDYSLSELEKKIDDLLRAAGKYFNENPDLQSIIRRYQKWTFLAYVYGPILKNESGLNDEELKAFLKEYDERFKIPVKELLIEYYRVMFNPNMTFDGALLDKLGFHQCAKCYGATMEDLFPHETDEVADDLPF